jgi:hypothetical protein
VRLAAAIAAGLVLAATSARAEPLYDAFQDLCLSTAADALAVLAKTGGPDWSALPEDQTARLAKSFGAGGEAQARINSKAKLLLLTGSATIPGENFSAKVKMCIVGSPGADGAAAIGQLTRYAAVPELSGKDKIGSISFAYLDEGQRHTAVMNVSDDKVIGPAIQTGKLRVLIADSSSAMPILGLMVPLK